MINRPTGDVVSLLIDAIVQAVNEKEEKAPLQREEYEQRNEFEQMFLVAMSKNTPTIEVIDTFSAMAEETLDSANRESKRFQQPIDGLACLQLTIDTVLAMNDSPIKITISKR